MDKEQHLMMIQESVPQEDVVILNVYAPNNKHPLHVHIK